MSIVKVIQQKEKHIETLKIVSEYLDAMVNSQEGYNSVLDVISCFKDVLAESAKDDEVCTTICDALEQYCNNLKTVTSYLQEQLEGVYTFMEIEISKLHELDTKGEIYGRG